LVEVAPLAETEEQGVIRTGILVDTEIALMVPIDT